MNLTEQFAVQQAKEQFSVLSRYANAMRNGCAYTCVTIEQDHGLYGYSPEVVSVGLKAHDEGRNVQEAVSEYLMGHRHEA